MDEPSYPGAVPPERTRRVRSFGIELQLYEWGDPERPPVVLCHGMFDNGRGFDLLAPFLAERFRVVAMDARGHGDSEWADAYHWPVDIEDLVHVLEDLGQPAHLVGHSRGGGQATDTAVRAPELVRRVVNMDGFGPPPEGFGPPGRDRPAPTNAAEDCARYLDRRRATTRFAAWRAYPELEDLVSRRRVQNPRLSEEWLRYFAWHGARETEDGWTWKVDPLTIGGFGPWRPEWIAPAWQGLRAPMLALTGSEPDTWGPLPEPLLSERLSYVANVERATIDRAGHFMHMERPRETAALLLDFLDAS